MRACCLLITGLRASAMIGAVTSEMIGVVSGAMIGVLSGAVTSKSALKIRTQIKNETGHLWMRTGMRISQNVAAGVNAVDAGGRDAAVRMRTSPMKIRRLLKLAIQMKARPHLCQTLVRIAKA